MCEYKNIFTKKRYKAYLEAIIGESYKKPWKTTIEIENPTSIVIEQKEIEIPKESMTISINDIKETKIIPEGFIDPDKLVELSETDSIKRLTEEDIKPEGATIPEGERPKNPKKNIFKEFINK